MSITLRLVGVSAAVIVAGALSTGGPVFAATATAASAAHGFAVDHSGSGHGTGHEGHSGEGHNGGDHGSTHDHGSGDRGWSRDHDRGGDRDRRWDHERGGDRDWRRDVRCDDRHGRDRWDCDRWS